jgi:hypothetical protein
MNNSATAVPKTVNQIRADIDNSSISSQHKAIIKELATALREGGMEWDVTAKTSDLAVLNSMTDSCVVVKATLKYHVNHINGKSPETVLGSPNAQVQFRDSIRKDVSTRMATPIERVHVENIRRGSLVFDLIIMSVSRGSSFLASWLGQNTGYSRACIGM